MARPVTGWRCTAGEIKSNPYTISESAKLLDFEGGQRAQKDWSVILISLLDGYLTNLELEKGRQVRRGSAVGANVTTG